MAGKVSGAIGGGAGFGNKGGAPIIPTQMWEEFSAQTGGRPETAGTEGAQLKKALDKSKSTGLKVP